MGGSCSLGTVVAGNIHYHKDMETASQKHTPYHTNTYTFVKLIGRGSYAVVYEAKNNKTGKPVAIKISDPIQWTKHASQNDSDIGIQSLLSDCTVPVIDTIIVSMNVKGLKTTLRVPGVVMPLANYSLAKLKVSTRTFKGALSLFHDVCVGVSNLHRRGILHLDLKPENVLIFDEKDGKRAAICDYGMSSFGCRDAGGPLHALVNHYVYSIPFRPPEISRQLISGSQRVTVTEQGEVFVVALIGLCVLCPQVAKSLYSILLDRTTAPSDKSNLVNLGIFDNPPVFVRSKILKMLEQSSVCCGESSDVLLELATVLTQMLDWTKEGRPSLSTVVCHKAFRPIPPIDNKRAAFAPTHAHMPMYMVDQVSRYVDLVWFVKQCALAMHPLWAIDHLLAAMSLAQRTSVFISCYSDKPIPCDALFVGWAILRAINRQIPFTSPHRSHVDRKEQARRMNLLDRDGKENAELRKAELWLLSTIKPLVPEKSGCKHEACFWRQYITLLAGKPRNFAPCFPLTSCMADRSSRVARETLFERFGRRSRFVFILIDDVKQKGLIV